ncbi:MAG: hypothetical protein R3C42_05005 [Parvularculaceae bacterium]
MNGSEPDRVLCEVLNAAAATGDLAVYDAPRTARILQDIFYRFASSSVYYEGEFGLLES